MDHCSPGGPARRGGLSPISWRARAARTVRRPSRSRNGSRSSTTTARCGARSRCPSSWTLSFDGWPRRPSRNPDLRELQPWKAVSERDYARERVIGSSSTFEYASSDRGGTITHKPDMNYLDNGPEKPVRIWNRIGRRPLLAAGNSNGDVPMLEFASHATDPTLRLLVQHDDADREFEYEAGAQEAVGRA